MIATELRVPTMAMLPDYRAALERGWAPSDVGGPELARAQLDRIASDPAGFVDDLDDHGQDRGTESLLDGTVVPVLPRLERWIWQDGFCGMILLRWQHGTADLPYHVLGHIGFVLVPWRQREGIATRALALMLGVARARGMPHVDLVARLDNPASHRVILANGGHPIGVFREQERFGGHESTRYRIDL